MTMTAQDSFWMGMRDSLSITEKFAIDTIFNSMYRVAEEEGLKAAGDDRAACLEAALVRFFIESREETKPVVNPEILARGF